MTASLVLDTPGLVHPILTTDQALITHQALIAFLNSPEGTFSDNEAEDQHVRKGISELVFFFSNVVDHPEAFGIRSGQETKRLIRQATAAPKGPAQPKSKRKRRQKSRPSFEKRMRQERKLEAEMYNEAARIMREEETEAEEANNDEMVKRIERMNELLLKDALRTEEVQEMLDILGYPNVAEAAREMRAADTPEARILAAQAKAEAENDPLE